MHIPIFHVTQTLIEKKDTNKRLMPIHLFHFSINTLCQWRFKRMRVKEENFMRRFALKIFLRFLLRDRIHTYMRLLN
jgi:hypothetical protein